MDPVPVSRISHLVVEIADLTRGEEFYAELLGFQRVGRDVWPDRAATAPLRTDAGQLVVLSENSRPRSLPETGVHQAYRVTRADRDAIGEKLARRGMQVYTYKEDRPAEREDNFYFYDPDGNRVQLVVADKHSAAAGAVQGIDHAAVEAVDIEWAEDFYAGVLGLWVEHRVGWRTEDYARAKLWGEGKEEMAPGARRWDKRYTVMERRRLLPRPNTHFFVRAGDAVLGIYLATQHRQEPPEEELVGTPRIAWRTDAAGIKTARERLAAHGRAFHGPVAHPDSAPIAASLYFKDPGGNFLELAVPR